ENRYKYIPVADGKRAALQDLDFEFTVARSRYVSGNVALQIGKTFLVCFAHNWHDKPAVSRDRNANVVKVILDKVIPFNATIHNRHGFERFHGRFHEERH